MQLLFAIAHVQMIAYGISLGMGLEVLGSMLTNFLYYGVYLTIIPKLPILVIQEMTEVQNSNTKGMTGGVELHSAPSNFIAVFRVASFLCQGYALYLNYQLLPPT